jgi:hypothetical protein
VIQVVTVDEEYNDEIEDEGGLGAGSKVNMD